MCAVRYIRSSVPYQPPHSGEVRVIPPLKKPEEKKAEPSQIQNEIHTLRPEAKRPRSPADESKHKAQKAAKVNEEADAHSADRGAESAEIFGDGSWYCELCEERVSVTRDAHERTMAHILSKQFTLGARNWVLYGIEKENVGRRMLRDLGWTEHEGLGKDGEGMKIPVMTRLKPDRKGIGAEGAAPLRVTHTQDEVEQEVAKARARPAAPRFMASAKDRAKRVKEDRHQEQRIREMIMSDSWEYLHQLDRGAK